MNREAELTIEAWEGDEYVICLNGRVIGQTLHRGDAHIVKHWLGTALSDILGEPRQYVKAVP